MLLSVEVIHCGDTVVAKVETDGATANVTEVLDCNGEVPVDLDWAMIKNIELVARCIWMDEMSSTWTLNGAEH